MSVVKARMRGGETDRLARRYFEWMLALVDGGRYRKLLKKLNDTKFDYILEKDSNRAADGIELRYRFGYENNIPRREIEENLDIRDCSVLEMMVALAHRCEEDIMQMAEEGDRTGEWFHEMLESMGLDDYDDRHWHAEAVDDILRVFLKRQYSFNGQGGLFTLYSQPRMDMRKVEIWYQMMAWLIEKDEGGKL